MIEINARQGSDQWMAIRAKHHTGSEAPIMMGASSKATRAELLRMKATGDEKEFSRWVKEVLFERGHEVEAAARPIAEKIVGEELFPTTATDDEGYLLASFDGITMLEDVIWECKQWNEAKAAEVREGRCPDEDYWQVVQQLVVSGAEKCLYMVTDGTEERTFTCWVEPDADDIEKLSAGWAQFDKDLAEWKPAETAPKVEGRAPGQLPALRVEVQGAVVASNLDEFRDGALAVFREIKTDLQTDEDFANAEATVRWCQEVEQRLKDKKSEVLSQTADIDALFSAIDDITEEARQTRLKLDRSVKSEKERRRDEIADNARQQLQDHIAEINKGLGTNIKLPEIPCDIAGAMRGKKKIDSLRAAADQAVADAKIEASRIGQKMQTNLGILREEAQGYETLFADAQQLVQKDSEDLRAVIRDRIREQKEAEEKRRQDEEARKAAEAAKEPAAAPEPAPAAAEPAPAPKPAAKGAQAPAQRPPDDEIVGAVAAHFAVTPDVARGWIADMRIARAA